MEENQVKAIIDEWQNAGLRVRSYSGRGMFGKECVGVTVASTFEAVAPLFELLSDGEEHSPIDAYELGKFVRGLEWDNMGYSNVIVYHRALKVPADFEESDDDDY